MSIEFVNNHLLGARFYPSENNSDKDIYVVTKKPDENGKHYCICLDPKTDKVSKLALLTEEELYKNRVKHVPNFITTFHKIKFTDYSKLQRNKIIITMNPVHLIDTQTEPMIIIDTHNWITNLIRMNDGSLSLSYSADNLNCIKHIDYPSEYFDQDNSIPDLSKMGLAVEKIESQNCYLKTMQTNYIDFISWFDIDDYRFFKTNYNITVDDIWNTFTMENIYKSTGLEHFLFINALDIYNMDNYANKFKKANIKTDKGYTDKEHIHYIDFKIALDSNLQTNDINPLFMYIFDYIKQTNIRFIKDKYPFFRQIDPLSIKLTEFTTQTDFLQKKIQLLKDEIYSTKLYFPIDDKLVILIYTLKPESNNTNILSQEELKTFLSKS